MGSQIDAKPNAVTIAVGGLLFVLAFYGLVRGIPTTKWPSTPGEVLHSSIQEKDVRHNDSYDYNASITYTYTVNGIKYNCSMIQRGLGEQLKNTKFLYALFTSKKYPKGTPITIYYKSENPAEAVIERGPDLATYLVMIVGVIFTVLGFNGKSLNIQFKKY
jgi:hypothetical protein